MRPPRRIDTTADRVASGPTPEATSHDVIVSDRRNQADDPIADPELTRQQEQAWIALWNQLLAKGA